MTASLPQTLVTGATAGIGHELALQLAEAGVAVVALGRNAAKLAALKKLYPQIDTVCCDLSDVASLPRVAYMLRGTFPSLSCIIHNAGMQDNMRLDDAGYGPQHIRTEVDVNLVAPMVLTQALLEQLMSKRMGMVVHITSGLAFAPKNTSAVYSATKAGLHLFSNALRLQMQGSGVHVVEVVMPLVDTAMAAGRGGGKLSAAEAAKQTIAGLLQRKETIWVGKTRALPFLLRWAPGILRRLIQRA